MIHRRMRRAQGGLFFTSEQMEESLLTGSLLLSTINITLLSWQVVWSSGGKKTLKQNTVIKYCIDGMT